MKTKRILGAILAVAMIHAAYPQAVTANAIAPDSYNAEPISICKDTPTSLKYERLLELLAQAPDFTETRSNITFADRRITETELTAWIAEYWGLGGMNSFELEVVRLINIERGNAGLQSLAIDPLLMMAARFHSQEMADLRYFNHRSPHHGRSTNRAEMFGHENIKEYVWGVRENISGSTRSPDTEALY